MADLLQRPFMILTRPTYTSLDGHTATHKGEVFTRIDGKEYTLGSIGHDTTAGATSPVVINSSGEYSADPWFLHTVSTSYENMRIKLKKLIALYGTDNVRVAQYIPIDYEVLPNQ